MFIRRILFKFRSPVQYFENDLKIQVCIINIGTETKVTE